MTLESCANVSKGAECPHCGSHKTWLTRMRWSSGEVREFWSCDGCRRTWVARIDSTQSNGASERPIGGEHE